MKVAGRKMVESISTSFRPGLSASSAASTLRVTSSVLPQRLLLDDQQQAGPVVDDRVADGRRMTFDDFGDVAQAQRRAVAK